MATENQTQTQTPQEGETQKQTYILECKTTENECVEAWATEPLPIINFGLVNGVKRIWLGRIWFVAFLHDYNVFIQRLVELPEIDEMPEKAIIIAGLSIYYAENPQIVKIYDVENAIKANLQNIIIPPGLSTRGYGIQAKTIKRIEKYEDLEGIATKIVELMRIDHLSNKTYVKVLNNSIAWPVKLWRPSKNYLILDVQPAE